MSVPSRFDLAFWWGGTCQTPEIFWWFEVTFTVIPCNPVQIPQKTVLKKKLRGSHGQFLSILINFSARNNGNSVLFCGIRMAVWWYQFYHWWGLEFLRLALKNSQLTWFSCPFVPFLFCHKGFVNKLDEFIQWLNEAMETTENWTPPKAETDDLKLYLETHLVGKIVLLVLLVMGRL